MTETTESRNRTAVRAVAASDPSPVLDLGAGTGALAAALLELTAGPGGLGDAGPTVELLDIDQEMLGHARERLASYGDRARFTVRSYYEPLPACDAAMASLSML